MESYSNRNYFDRKRSASPSYYDESKYNDYISDHDSRSPPDWQTKRDRDYDRSHDRREHSVERGTRDYKDYRDSGRDRNERTYSRDGYDRDRDYEHRSRKDRESERGSRDRSGSREHDFSDSDSYRNKTTFSDSREGRRDYDKDKDKRSVDWDRESNRSSRYNERDRSRERGRNDRDRSRSRRRSYDRDRDRDRRDRRRDDDRRRDGEHEEEMIDHTEGINYKNQAPNNTIMIRGLAQHITENDIRQDIMLSSLLPKDIRLIRKRDTGASRGFAFVEFATLQEATRWMEMKQGVLMLQDQYRAIMLYSIPKDQRANSSLSSSTDKTACKSDWICIKCGARNFRRRGNCYKCQTSRTESEVSLYATKTIMLRNLDALSTEDSVMSVLKVVVGSMVKYINGVLIGRDPLTQTSRGICYLDLESTVEALTLFGALNALNPPLTIDGKKVTVSYCKYRMGDLTQIFPQVALDNISTAQMYQMSDVNTLADYSASRYAKTPEQYHQYFEYYKNYFQQQVSQGVAISINQDSQINSTNAAAAVAQLAIKQRQGKLGIMTPMMSMMMVPPNGQDGKRYPLPDVSSYQYDESTGYYYDMSTGLYYDANSQYYYNSTIQKYLYWDSTKMTYLLAPTNETASTATAAAAVATVATVQQESAESVKPAEESEQQTSKKKTKGEKSDKAKVAKQIAKDMERWAKTMNKSKEALRPSTSNENSSGSNFASTAGSADIGFAVLEKKAAIAPNPTMMLPLAQSSSLEMRMLNSSQAQSSTLVAAYGSDDSGDDEPVIEGFPEGLDWDSRICLLCKRKFPSKEALAKHQKVSDLHRSNLEQIYAQRNINKGQTIKYRDRAKERREKFGEADSPPPSKLKEKYLKAREIVEPVISALPTAPIGENNLGNKLLQKMGWSEGQGLGKSNQGRTTIIETEKRVSNAGLGTKANAYTSQPGDTYKDCVKKMMYARYQELSNT